tara:strand:- start:502 stop:1404 length:903 start_codon:yes stop_codon:yes gene_type:complete
MQPEITDENFKKQIIFLLNNSWTGRGDMYFPLQNSINIEKRYLFKLKNFKYVFYKKDTSDTKRAILFFFIDKDGNNTSVVILKDFTIYKLDIQCSDEYYRGTIFDVSYKPDEICIYDTFTCCGSKINNITYLDRIEEAQTFKSNIHSSNVSIKLTEYSESINFYKDNFKDTDEIFMIPNDLPIITGVNYSCFKWKPANLITFSLLVKENKEDLELYSTIFKNETIFAKIHKSDPEGQKYIECIKSLENYKDRCIIDVNVSNKIEIMGINCFKTIPNTIRSIEKIMAIKHEDLKLKDLDFN